MGLDLDAMPDCWQSVTEQEGVMLAYERVRFDRNYDLYNELFALAHPASKAGIEQVDYYGDEGIETREADGVGDPLVFVTGMQIRSNLPELLEQTHPGSKNAAIIQYLSHLPPHTNILLWKS